jgi:DNA-binding MarR family transcriptional regulator
VAEIALAFWQLRGFFCEQLNGFAFLRWYRGEKMSIHACIRRREPFNRRSYSGPFIMGYNNALAKIAGRRGGEAEDYQLEQQVGFLLRVALQRHFSLFAVDMLEGLTAPQYAAMYKLFEVGACAQNQLGRLIKIDVATINGIVRRLKAKGFLTSRGDPHDKRRHQIELSPAGRRILERALPIAMKISAKTLEPLSRSERETLLRLLKKIG